MSPSRRLAILAAFSGQGGVEKMMLNLLDGFAPYDVHIDLLAIVRKDHPLPESSNPRVRVLKLAARHSGLALPEVIRYLRKQQPEAMLAVRDRGIRVAVWARRLTQSPVRLVGNLHSNLSAALDDKSVWQRFWRLHMARQLYRSADRIIAVSGGVAEDARRIAGLPSDRFVAIPNPVITAKFFALSQEPIAHPEWLGTGAPLIIGAGRITPQKDFATLIRAFALLRKQQPARLLILGEGRLRPILRRLVADLGLENEVGLPGFVDNPYPYMARASLFVLSSQWEGSPTVLTESLALGVPVVSTDCPSGPRETLGDGRYGPLVPVGDADSLAEAMQKTLASPPPEALLRAAAQEFFVERSAERYLTALGFGDLVAKAAKCR